MRYVSTKNIVFLLLQDVSLSASYLKPGEKCQAMAGREWDIKWPSLWVRVKSIVIKISVCCNVIGGRTFSFVFLNRRLIRFVGMYSWSFGS